MTSVSGSNYMTKTSTKMAACLAVSLMGAGYVSAQEVSTSEIVNKLAPNRSLKRSVLSSAGMNAADKDFLRRLPGRGISFEQRTKLAVIVADKKLPSIDIPIQFEFDSAKITFDAYKQVEALANALKNPKLAKTRVSVNGYTDAKGTDQHNHVLSEERAASVQEALINEFGIAPDRLVAVGFGEEGLKAPDDPEGAVNRRVEVVSIGEL